jgi:proline iminopeptidase
MSSEKKKGLYPKIEPYAEELVPVGDGHQIYVERCGNKKGIPVVFLHGGPGGGCKSDHRQFFNPKKYHIFLLDQRGSGRSIPYGSVVANTTNHLIKDLELIRKLYSVNKFVLFAGSWGVTLALAYAEAFPTSVSGMIFRGSFLARRKDVDWFFGNGANRFLPAQWDRFISSLNMEDISNISDFLYDAIMSGDQERMESAARAWEIWSGSVVMFSIDGIGSGESHNINMKSAIVKAKIEFHYAKHGYFMKENQLIEDIDKLPKVSCKIVHGSRDLTCLPESAWLLHKLIPNSSINFLRSAGHLSSEKDMIYGLIEASDEMAAELSSR